MTFSAKKVFSIIIDKKGKQTQEIDDVKVTWSYSEYDHFYILYERK